MADVLQASIVVVESIHRLLFCSHGTGLPHPAIVKDANIGLSGSKLANPTTLIAGSKSLCIAPR
jgi:hypothetical protein